MQERSLPFQKMVFVCTHKREGESACNNDCAGDFWLELLRKEVLERGLKGKVRIVKSGCLDVCAAGANLLIVSPNEPSVWLSRLQKEDAPEVLQKVF